MESYLMRKLGKDMAKTFLIWAEEEKESYNEDKTVAVEIDENYMICFLRGGKQETVSIFKCMKKNEDDAKEVKELLDIAYKSFLKKMCKLWGEYTTIERDGQKILRWEL